MERTLFFSLLFLSNYSTAWSGLRPIVPERCEFPQWGCPAENNDSNSWTVPAGSEAGLTCYCRDTVAVLFHTRWLAPSGGIRQCLCHDTASAPTRGTGNGLVVGVIVSMAVEWTGLPASSLLWEVKRFSGVIKSQGMKRWQSKNMVYQHPAAFTHKCIVFPMQQNNP